MHSLRGPIKRPESREEVQDQRHERSNSRWPVTTVTHGNDPNSVSCTIKSCQKVLIIITLFMSGVPRSHINLDLMT